MDRRIFLVSKATNLRTLLTPFIKTPEHTALLSQYSEKDIETLTATYLLPLYATGTLSVATSHLASELGITDAALLEKVGRYFQCFCETLQASG